MRLRTGPKDDSSPSSKSGENVARTVSLLPRKISSLRLRSKSLHQISALTTVKSKPLPNLPTESSDGPTGPSERCPTKLDRKLPLLSLARQEQKHSKGKENSSQPLVSPMPYPADRTPPLGVESIHNKMTRERSDFTLPPTDLGPSLEDYRERKSAHDRGILEASLRGRDHDKQLWIQKHTE